MRGIWRSPIARRERARTAERSARPTLDPLESRVALSVSSPGSAGPPVSAHARQAEVTILDARRGEVEVAGDRSSHASPMLGGSSVSREGPTPLEQSFLDDLNTDLAQLGLGRPRVFSAAGKAALGRIDLGGNPSSVTKRLKAALRSEGAHFTESRSIVWVAGNATVEGLGDSAADAAIGLRSIIGKNKSYRSHNYIGVNITDQGQGHLSVGVVTYSAKGSAAATSSMAIASP